MPFLAAIPAGLGALIGGGAAVGGSLIARSASNRATQAQSQIAQQQLELQKQQQALAERTYNTGAPLLQEGAAGLRLPINFHQSILQGGSSANRALMSPISDITKGYQQGRQNTAMFAPRGSSASSYANYGRQMAGDIARLKSDNLVNSAGELGKLNSTLLGTGAGLMSGGQSGLAGAAATSLGIGNQALQNRQISSQNNSSLGQGLGSLLGILLGPGGLLSNRGGSGSLPTSIIQPGTWSNAALAGMTPGNAGRGY